MVRILQAVRNFCHETRLTQKISWPRLLSPPATVAKIMPRAEESPCAVCHAPSSRYTCPFCDATTCSLPCFKTHKGDRACASARAVHERQKDGPFSSLLMRPDTAPSAYVSMNKYDYNQMVRDYQFLNQVGRVAASTGRHLVDKGLVQPPGPPSGAPRRSSAAQHRRDQYAKQVSYRRLPIMLLPDGMSKRSANRSHWEPKRKQLCLTVHYAFPSAAARADELSGAGGLAEQGALVHGQNAQLPFSYALLAELERASARQAGEKLAQWSARPATEPLAKRRRQEDEGGRERDDVADSTAEAAQGPWRISGSLLRQLGVPSSEQPETYTALPDNAVLLLRVYQSRLRNESTTKYLDWWNRKGAALEQEKYAAAMASGSAQPQAPEAQRRAEPLVPQHVLDSVSRMQTFLHPEAPGGHASAAPSTPAQSRTLVLIPTGASAPSMEQVLKRLPAGVAVVEYPELEVWPQDRLLQAERRGEVQLLALEEKEDRGEQAQREPAATAASTETSAGPPPEPSAEPSATLPPANASLVAYAESEEDE